MKKVAVLGTSCLDRVIVPRLGTAFDFSKTTQVIETAGFGGSMHNIAYHLGLLGVPVDFYTKVGNDDLSNQLVEDLKRNGVSVHATEVTGACPVFTCLEDQDHGKIYLSTVDERYFFNAQDQLDAAFFEDVAYGITDNNDSAFFHQLINVSCHTKWTMNARKIPFEWMSMLDGYILNRDEAARYGFSSLDDFAKACLAAGLHYLVVTLDKDGLVYYDHQTSQQMKPLTSGKGLSLGCGDAFSAGLMYGRSRGLSVIDALSYGLKASALIYKKTTAVSQDIVQIKENEV